MAERRPGLPRRTRRTRRDPPSIRLIISVLGILCGSILPAQAAIDDYLGKPIGAVRIVLEERDATDPALTQVIETVVGQRLAMAQVRESIAHLFSLGRFEDVRVDATLEGGRVALRYELSPVHPVTRIEFAGHVGAPGIDTTALRRALTDRYGVTPPVGRTADMVRILGDLLHERGYLHPEVTPHVQLAHRPERATLSFTIEPGARTTIGPVDIVGTPTLPRAAFLQRLRVVAGTPYQRDQLNTRIERYVAERRSRGYYEAKVQPSVRLTDDDRVAEITLAVDPGPHVRVVFAGDALPADRRDELVPVEREGSVDEDLLEDSSNRIEEFLRAQGYRDAAAPRTRSERNGELVITFTVKKGPLYRVTTYTISGNASVPLLDLEPGLRLRDGQPFSDSRLDADVQTIEDAYHRRGFASARAQRAVEPDRMSANAAQVGVAIRVVVNEGVRTIVDSVAFNGNTAITEAALRGRIALQPGAPFVPGQLAVDREAINGAYQDLGYESATVEARTVFSGSDTHVAVVFAIREGPQIFVDHVLIVGNVRTRTDTIERELQVRSGDPFSLSKINDSQRRLVALGLFRRARINELRHGDETTRDLLVTIEETPPTTVGYGAGVEGRLRVVPSAEQGGAAAERFEVAPRASFEVGRRNLFGKNRSANLFTSISRTVYGLTEYRAIGTFREPHLFDTAADAFLNVTLEKQIRPSFTFRRSSASAQIARRVSRDLSVTGSYQIQRTELLDVNIDPSQQQQITPVLNRLFSKEPLRLSSVSASVIRDTRNDAVNPTSGAYLSATGQLTAQAIGSQVGFAKSFFTAQTFRTMAGTNGIVLAGNARLGTAGEFNADNPIPEPERFFAGGDTTVRGFALDQLGIRHVPPAPGDTIDKDGFAIGGNGLVIFNAELRAPVRGGLGLVGFVDAGNVFARVADLDLMEMRTAVGGGIRYKSPFGPLRVDLGFKVHRQPGEGLTAFFVSFGQAF